MITHCEKSAWEGHADGHGFWGENQTEETDERQEVKEKRGTREEKQTWYSFRKTRKGKESGWLK